MRAAVLCVALCGCRPAAPVVAPAAAATEVARVEAVPEVLVRGDAAPVFADPRRREKLAEAFPEVRRRVEAFVAAEELPGVAAGVVIDGELALFVGAGVADLETRAGIDEHSLFRIGSLTKLVTATVIVGLRDEGKLGLDEPARRYVAAFDRLVYPTRDVRRITIRDLLLHDSGLPRLGDFNYTDPVDPPTRAEIEGSLERYALRREPGAQYEYSNLGYMLLGLVIEEVTREGYAQVVVRKLLEPIGVEDAAWGAAEAGTRLATGYARRNGRWIPQAHWNLGAGAAAGGLYMSIEGLGRFAALHLLAWPARDDAETGPVRRASLREMARMADYEGMRVTGTNDATREARAWGRGLGWGVEQDCRFEVVLGHNGGTEGYASTIHLLPTRGVGLVLLTNGAGAPLGRLADEVLALLDGTGALAQRRIPPLPALTATVAELAGLLASWDVARARRLVAGYEAPEAALRRIERELAWGRERFGACGEWIATSVPAADTGTFTATCERGKLSMQVGLTGQDPPQIGTIKLSARGGAADAAVVEAAGRATRLLSAWDPELFAEALSPDFPREGTRLELLKANPSGAACELGAAEVVRPGGATFAVRCGDEALRMAVDHVDVARRIGRFTVDPAPRDRCGRAGKR